MDKELKVTRNQVNRTQDKRVLVTHTYTLVAVYLDSFYLLVFMS